MPNIARSPCDEAAILARTPGERAAGGFWVLTVAILGSSMAFIDGTVVSVALPALQSSLHATIGDVQWVVEAYTLLLAALLLTGGSLGDLFSLRKVFAAGVILFAAASAGCGLVPNIGQPIAARSLQGVSGALLVPGGLALISVAFPSGLRGRAIGTWSGFASITTAIGRVLGGWLVQHASWRWVFFINLPIAFAVIAQGIAAEKSTIEALARNEETLGEEHRVPRRLGAKAPWPQPMSITLRASNRSIGMGRAARTDRLFSFITQNWRGRPLGSHEVIINLLVEDYPKDTLSTRGGVR
jgi:MFS family permease